MLWNMSSMLENMCNNLYIYILEPNTVCNKTATITKITVNVCILVLVAILLVVFSKSSVVLVIFYVSPWNTEAVRQERLG
jgi:hypothetical protein